MQGPENQTPHYHAVASHCVCGLMSAASGSRCRSFADPNRLASHRHQAWAHSLSFWVPPCRSRCVAGSLGSSHSGFPSWHPAVPSRMWARWALPKLPECDEFIHHPCTCRPSLPPPPGPAASGRSCRRRLVCGAAKRVGCGCDGGLAAAAGRGGGCCRNGRRQRRRSGHGHRRGAPPTCRASRPRRRPDVSAGRAATGMAVQHAAGDARNRPARLSGTVRRCHAQQGEGTQMLRGCPMGVRVLVFLSVQFPASPHAPTDPLPPVAPPAPPCAPQNNPATSATS